MNKFISKRLTNLLLCLVSSLAMLPVVSAEFDGLHFIGFSNDGNYMAFETYGFQDGSETAYSKITLINVAQNSWQSSPIKASIVSPNLGSTQNSIPHQRQAVQQVRNQNKATANARLAALGIVEGATGAHVVSRFLTDLNENNEPVRFTRAVHPSVPQEGDFQLTLTEKVGSSSKCAPYVPPARKIFELRLKNLDTNAIQVLQNDTILFNSRGCPSRYRISDVYVRGNLLVVFLNIFKPGWEGTSMSYLAVTGVIQ